LQALQSLGAHAQATLFMTLHAAFSIILGRYAGQDDVSIGTFIANRNRAELEQLIGFFVNTLVLRSRIDPRQTFNDFLQQVRSTTLDGYTNQDVPFEFLLDALKPARNAAYTPLFQAMLVLQNTPLGKTSLPGLEVEPLASSEVSANFDLLLECTEQDGKLDCAFIYSTELFDGNAGGSIFLPAFFDRGATRCSDR
jgi:non-ribosomal peptide synthetase component F